MRFSLVYLLLFCAAPAYASVDSFLGTFKYLNGPSYRCEPEITFESREGHCNGIVAYESKDGVIPEYMRKLEAHVELCRINKADPTLIADEFIIDRAVRTLELVAAKEGEITQTHIMEVSWLPGDPPGDVHVRERRFELVDDGARLIETDKWNGRLRTTCEYRRI